MKTEPQGIAVHQMIAGAAIDAFVLRVLRQYGPQTHREIYLASFRRYSMTGIYQAVDRLLAAGKIQRSEERVKRAGKWAAHVFTAVNGNGSR